jgi:hypothetical protein
LAGSTHTSAPTLHFSDPPDLDVLAGNPYHDVEGRTDDRPAERVIGLVMKPHLPQSPADAKERFEGVFPLYAAGRRPDDSIIASSDRADDRRSLAAARPRIATVPIAQPLSQFTLGHIRIPARGLGTLGAPRCGNYGLQVYRADGIVALLVSPR